MKFHFYSVSRFRVMVLLSGLTLTTVIKAQTGCPMATFQDAKNIDINAQAKSLITGDFNKDGNLDLIYSGYFPVENDNFTCIRFGDGKGDFSAAAKLDAGRAGVLITEDFNNDGKLDLAMETAYDSIGVRLGNGQGSFGPATIYNVGKEIWNISSGDFNNDGQVDLATSNYSTGTISILLNKGNGSFGQTTNIPLGESLTFVATGDFNGDGNLDLTTASEWPSNISVLLGMGDGTFGPPTSIDPGDNPWAIVTADFNEDGNLDMAVANPGNNQVSVFLGHGDGSFEPPAGFAVGSYPAAITTRDINGDGNLDLITPNGNEAAVYIQLGDGKGGFAPAVRFNVGLQTNAVAAGDFDGNGSMDLAIGNFMSHHISVLLNACNPDTDGDGDYDALDCAPNKAAIHHGATEIPDDGIDQNCDGYDLKTWYLDNDRDGYGNTAIYITANTQPKGYVSEHGDCDDTKNTMHPGAMEICGNGFDENCNGVVDDGCGPCANTTSLRITNTTTSSVTLNWSATVNPNQWQIQYKKLATGSKWMTLALSGALRSYTLFGLLQNQKYKWRIRAKCGTTWTPYSNEGEFKTAANATTSTTRSARLKLPQAEEALVVPNLQHRSQIWRIPNLPTRNKITVVDANGQVVLQAANYANNKAFNTAAPGVYFYQIRTTQAAGQSKTYMGKLLIVD